MFDKKIVYPSVKAECPKCKGNMIPFPYPNPEYYYFKCVKCGHIEEG